MIVVQNILQILLQIGNHSLLQNHYITRIFEKDKMAEIEDAEF